MNEYLFFIIGWDCMGIIILLLILASEAIEKHRMTKYLLLTNQTDKYLVWKKQQEQKKQDMMHELRKVRRYE